MLWRGRWNVIVVISTSPAITCALRAMQEQDLSQEDRRKNG
jgi:predicted acetyltransferase